MTMPQMSDSAAQQPLKETNQHKLHGVFSGNEDIEITGNACATSRSSRAHFSRLTSLQSTTARLVQQVHEIPDLHLRRSILTETLPCLVFPIADATALTVELLFSYEHVRRQNLLRAALATTADYVEALIQHMPGQ